MLHSRGAYISSEAEPYPFGCAKDCSTCGAANYIIEQDALIVQPAYACLSVMVRQSYVSEARAAAAWISMRYDLQARTQVHKQRQSFAQLQELLQLKDSTSPSISC